MQKFDFSNDFMEGVQGEKCRQLYELLAEALAKKDISEALTILELIFGDLENRNTSSKHNMLGIVLGNILKGGLPFHNFDFEEFSGKNWT